MRTNEFRRVKHRERVSEAISVIAVDIVVIWSARGCYRPGGHMNEVFSKSGNVLGYMTKRLSAHGGCLGGRRR